MGAAELGIPYLRKIECRGADCERDGSYRRGYEQSETDSTGSAKDRSVNIHMISWIVLVLGIIVSLLGWYLIPDAWGYGIFGFGLAHILLGIADMLRHPSERLRT